MAESTNHNIWTLTVNVSKSINNAAGKLDAKLYGKPTPTNAPVTNAIVEVPAPEPKKELPNVVALLGGFFFVGCIFFLLWRIKFIRNKFGGV
jgi:hypothetical protein